MAGAVLIRSAALQAAAALQYILTTAVQDPDIRVLLLVVHTLRDAALPLPLLCEHLEAEAEDCPNLPDFANAAAAVACAKRCIPPFRCFRRLITLPRLSMRSPLHSLLRA